MSQTDLQYSVKITVPEIPALEQFLEKSLGKRGEHWSLHSRANILDDNGVVSVRFDVDYKESFLTLLLLQYDCKLEQSITVNDNGTATDNLHFNSLFETIY